MDDNQYNEIDNTSDDLEENTPSANYSSNEVPSSEIIEEPSEDTVSSSSVPHHQPHVNSPLTRRNNQGGNTETPQSTQETSQPVKRKKENSQRPRIGVAPRGNSNGESNGNVGANRLKNALSKAKNYVNKRRKGKSNNANSASDTSDNNNDNDNSSNDNNDDSSKKGKGILSARLKIKIILYGTLILLIILMILALLMAVFGIDVSQTIPAITPSTYGTDGYESRYEKDSKEYKEELEYNKKLAEASENYAKKYGEELKTNYIHSFLIYLYYSVDIEEIDPNANDVDYPKLTSMIDKVVELMKPSDSGKTIDYEKKGEFYNNLKNSSLFIDYYKPLLKKEKADDILNEIFDLAEDLGKIEVPDETVITSETTIEYEIKEPTPTNKPTVTSTPTSTTTKKMSINEYLADSIYASSSTNNAELVKAYTITYSTNIVSDNKKLTITSQNAKASNPLCSVKLGCSYDSSGNLVDGGGSQSNKNTIYYNGKYYYKLALSSSEQNDLNKNINSVFGNVLVNSDGTYPSLDPNKLYGLGDGDYKTIMSSAYGSNLQFKNVGEDSYANGINFGNKKVLSNVIFYDQKDYKGKYCNLNGMTIGGSGCALTAMAMVTSTYKQSRQFDPLYMNEEARKIGNVCSYTGTSASFFCKEAKRRGFKCSGGGKGKAFLQNVINHLIDGDLVIAHMHNGKFTSKGHYIVLGGVDPETKKVYVYDPNNRSNKSNRNTGNGWYSFNDVIVKEAWNFYIVWQRK